MLSAAGAGGLWTTSGAWLAKYAIFCTPVLMIVRLPAPENHEVGALCDNSGATDWALLRNLLGEDVHGLWALETFSEIWTS